MNKRGSGVLLHITSLPSPFGIGDLGPGAYRFADFLAETRQTYWQVLPLSPTAPVYGNSPYSSVSTFAGNTLLISPEFLVRDGLLSPKEADMKPDFPDGQCDYGGAILYKERLLDRAHQTFFKSGKNRDRFLHFCEDQAGWLDTYSLFAAIKKRMGGKSWGEWPWELRDRAADHIERIRGECAADIEREKLGQFLFHPVAGPQRVLQRAGYTDNRRHSHLRELRQRRCVGQYGHLQAEWREEAGSAVRSSSRLFQLDRTVVGQSRIRLGCAQAYGLCMVDRTAGPHLQAF